VSERWHHHDGCIDQGDVRLYYQCWRPADAPRAAVALVHGLGGHGGIFDNVGEYLAARGHAVYALDLRGHGRSGGKRGCLGRWDDYRGDLHALVRRVRHTHPQTPLFLYGHSLGSAVTLEYALRHPQGLAGVIATGAPLGQVSIAAWKMAIARFLSRVWPRFTLDGGIAAGDATRNKAAIARVDSDPLCHMRGSARLATEFNRTVAYLHAHAPELRVPLLMLHGSADSVAAPEGSAAFFSRVTAADKCRIVYPGGYHEVHNDLPADKALADVADWLAAHTAERVVQATRSPAKIL
jgi:alpha-beta hydrolase superfamily lysophospholipase